MSDSVTITLIICITIFSITTMAYLTGNTDKDDKDK